jgi:hypothetical protein
MKRAFSEGERLRKKKAGRLADVTGRLVPVWEGPTRSGFDDFVYST